jgi:phenylacetate-coenzyme A ligase PaaK-like adenylate-forming protein
MRRLSIEIELVDGGVDAAVISHHLASELRSALGLTVPVRIVDSGSLPRFEMKARRFVVEK